MRTNVRSAALVAKPTIPDKKTNAIIGFVIVSAITLGLVLWLYLVRIPQAHQARNRLGDTVAQLSTLAAQNQAKLQALGQKPVGPPAPSVSAGKATAPPTSEAPVTPAPTYEQQLQPTQSQVTAGVSVYFTLHPPKLPFTTQTVVNKLIPFVTAYLHSHPAPAGKNGTDGKNGTNGAAPNEQQIDSAVQTFLPAAVAAYFTANPPPSGATGPSGAACDPDVNLKCVGPSGATGEPGPGPTEQQIADAVANYFSAHPLACPSGYTAAQETAVTTSGDVLLFVCVADNQPTPPATSTEPASPSPTETPS